MSYKYICRHLVRASFIFIGEKLGRVWQSNLPYIFLSIIAVLIMLFFKSVSFSAFAKLLFCLLDSQFKDCKPLCQTLRIIEINADHMENM